MKAFLNVYVLYDKGNIYISECRARFELYVLKAYYSLNNFSVSVLLMHDKKDDPSDKKESVCVNVYAAVCVDVH